MKLYYLFLTVLSSLIYHAQSLHKPEPSAISNHGIFFLVWDITGEYNVFVSERS